MGDKGKRSKVDSNTCQDPHLSPLTLLVTLATGSDSESHRVTHKKHAPLSFTVYGTLPVHPPRNCPRGQPHHPDIIGASPRFPSYTDPRQRSDERTPPNPLPPKLPVRPCARRAARALVTRLPARANPAQRAPGGRAGAAARAGGEIGFDTHMAAFFKSGFELSRL